MRVAAYGGVMATRVQEQQEPAETPAAAPAQTQQGRQHLELAAMQLAHPGLISVTRVTPQEVE